MVAQAKIDEMEKTGTIESDKSQENEKAVQLKEGKGKRKGGRGGKSPSKDSSSKSQAKMEKDAQVQVKRFILSYIPVTPFFKSGEKFIVMLS